MCIHVFSQQEKIKTNVAHCAGGVASGGGPPCLLPPLHPVHHHHRRHLLQPQHRQICRGWRLYTASTRLFRAFWIFKLPRVFKVKQCYGSKDCRHSLGPGIYQGDHTTTKLFLCVCCISLQPMLSHSIHPQVGVALCVVEEQPFLSSLLLVCMFHRY